MKGKYYHGGPKCKYHGTIVDCLTFASESAGMTGKILVKVSEYFDGIDLLPWVNDGKIWMLVVDGHQSHLDPQFVDQRPKMESMPWCTLCHNTLAGRKCIITKCFWKIRMVLWKGKAASMEEWAWLTKSNSPRRCHADNGIFFKAYGNEENNSKTTAEHGWLPPNRKF